jgi:hypothetical protein
MDVAFKPATEMTRPVLVGTQPADEKGVIQGRRMGTGGHHNGVDRGRIEGGPRS